MFAIEATNSRKWRWIAGIFLQRTAAETFLQSALHAGRSELCIVDLPVQCYPVFIIEERGFEYGDVNPVRAELASLVPRGNEDHIHMNVYAVREDFAPSKPGVDVMGLLLHWHITDRYLEPRRLLAFDEELSSAVKNLSSH